MIMFGVLLVVFLGFMALAIDLGRTYVVRTELQNAADAAALAGAKDLNQKAAGVTAAMNTAIKMAAQNKFNFSSPVTITAANLSVGSCPDDSCMVLASSIGNDDALASDKTFLKVNIPSGTLTTFFAKVIGISSTNTFGNAVAGKYLIDITPMAICQLSNTPDFGYEMGVSYRVADANPIGSGTPYWIDPVATSAGNCSGNTNNTLPYVCAGKLAFTPTIGQTVYTNTGVSDPQLSAIDSRFNVFNGQNKCDPASAPPDTNIKEYAYADSLAGSPKNWMNPAPSQQSLTFGTFAGKYGPKPIASRSFADYGVLWSGSRPDGKTVANWPSLYHGNAVNYPETSPYVQPLGSSFFTAPLNNAGKSGRRMMRMLIVSCPSGNGTCRPTTVLGVGKFFLQKKANTPGDKNVYVEYSGLESAVLDSEIRLYR